MYLHPKSLIRPLVGFFVLLALLWVAPARAQGTTAWAIEVPGLGPVALYGKDAKSAIEGYFDGLIRRKVFPKEAKALRALSRDLAASAGTARPVSTIAQGRPLSGIQLNSADDFLGTEAHLASVRAYRDGLARVGNASVFFPPADSRAFIDVRLASVHHLTLIGGQDIAPFLYGQPVTHANREELNLVRDRYERALVRRALASSLPIDGTCRGEQMLNVAAGGTLVQDIHADGLTTRVHVAPGFQPMSHSVLLTHGSELEETVGRTNIRAVPSMHHEAVGRVGQGFIVAARASDGVIEAIEKDHGRVRGYQFHPELAPRSAFSKAIFASISTRARSYQLRHP